MGEHRNINCRITHFLRGIGMKTSSLKKIAKKNLGKSKKQKIQTHIPCQASPQTLPMGLILLCFFFFWFSRDFGQIAKNHEKHKKKSDPCPRPLPRSCPWI